MFFWHRTWSVWPFLSGNGYATALGTSVVYIFSCFYTLNVQSGLVFFITVDTVSLGTGACQILLHSGTKKVWQADLIKKTVEHIVNATVSQKKNACVSLWISRGGRIKKKIAPVPSLEHPTYRSVSRCLNHRSTGSCSKVTMSLWPIVTRKGVNSSIGKGEKYPHPSLFFNMAAVLFICFVLFSFSAIGACPSECRTCPCTGGYNTCPSFVLDPLHQMEEACVMVVQYLYLDGPPEITKPELRAHFPHLKILRAGGKIFWVS